MIENESPEEWRMIDFNPAYEISSLGRVRYWKHEGVLYRGQQPVFVPSFVKPSVSNKGYERTSIPSNGKMKSMTIHRLVALAFIPNPLNKSQVNHKNRMKKDNRADNLEWMTARENVDHAIALNGGKGFGPSGEKSGASKLKEEDVRFIRQSYQDKTMSAVELSIKFGITRRAVTKVTSRKSWDRVL